MAGKNLNLKYRRVWLVVGYALIAFVLYSSLTSTPVKVDIIYFDKYAHTLAYFSLMGWFMQIYQTKRAVLVCAFLFICMGTGLEFVQGMTGYRYFDYYDMAANTLGVVIAWTLGCLTRFSRLLAYFENILVGTRA